MGHREGRCHRWEGWSEAGEGSSDLRCSGTDRLSRCQRGKRHEQIGGHREEGTPKEEVGRGAA